MRILVACEFSGIVREAFAKRGHDAWSCDLLPTEIPGQHIQGDVLELLNNDLNWDLMIAHPPCTHLAVAGAVWWKDKQKDGRQQESIEFFMKLANADINKIAIENPPGIMTKAWRKPDQYIQPYWFGHEAQKKLGLWLKNLEPLEKTNLVDRGEIYITKSGKSRGGAWTMKIAPSEERWKERSRTFQGIAEAMAEQWGVL
jgi:site-specific DNA-cytosine methylase